MITPENMKTLVRHIKNLAFSAVFIFVAMFADTIAQNLSLFNIGTTEAAIIGVILGHISSYASERAKLEHRVAGAFQRAAGALKPKTRG